MLKQLRLRVTTTGEDGSAVGSARSEGTFSGIIKKVHVDYHASAPATTDLTLKSEHDPATVLVVNKADSVTDATYYPVIQCTAPDGTAVTGVYAPPVVAGDYLTASVAGCNALAPAVTIDVFYEDLD